MQKSLQGTSQFVAFDASMEKSMCGSSQKIPIQNASNVNKIQRQKDMKAFKQLKIKGNKSIKEAEQQQQNQFLNVGKWNKQRQSQVRKAYEKDQSKQKQKQVQNSARDNNNRLQQSQQVGQPMTSKWQKKKSSQSSSLKSPSLKQEQNKKTSQNANVPKQPLKNKEQSQQEEQNQDQEEQEEQDQDDDEQDEEEDQEEQQQGEEQEEEDEQEEEIKEQQLQQQEQQQIEDRSDQDFEQSSDAYKTQTVNTSAMDNTPKPSKWTKKAPLQTMTKYEDKQRTQAQKNGKGYYSRLNSETNDQKQEERQIIEEISPENAEEWQRVEKVLMRIKLMLS